MLLKWLRVAEQQQISVEQMAAACEGEAVEVLEAHQTTRSVP